MKKPAIPSHWREHYASLLQSDDELADRVASENWPSLLSMNEKLAKGEKRGILTAGLHLSPGNESGVNLCPWSTDGCRAACLGHSSGRMRFTASKRARLLRTIFMLTKWEAFSEQLHKEVLKLARKASKHDMTPSVRLNTTSDLPWERYFPELFKAFPDVLFYDYTKSKTRVEKFLVDDLWPLNYHLTFSYNGHNWPICDYLLQRQATVAVVFSDELPTKHNGYTVIDGDETDCRSLDSNAVIVGLHAKGAAKQDTTGFVIKCPR